MPAFTCLNTLWATLLSKPDHHKTRVSKIEQSLQCVWHIHQFRVFTLFVRTRLKVVSEQLGILSMGKEGVLRLDYCLRPTLCFVCCSVFLCSTAQNTESIQIQNQTYIDWKPFNRLLLIDDVHVSSWCLGGPLEVKLSRALPLESDLVQCLLSTFTFYIVVFCTFTFWLAVVFFNLVFCLITLFNLSFFNGLQI